MASYNSRFRVSQNSATVFSSIDPTVNDDQRLGYLYSTFWVNQASGRAFVCSSPETGAAQWVEIGGGGGGTSGISWSVVDTDTSSINGRGYFVDASAGPRLLTLPPSPHQGDRVGVILSDATNPLTLLRNGSLLMGGTSDITLSQPGDGLILLYAGPPLGWCFESDTRLSATVSWGSISGNIEDQADLWLLLQSSQSYTHLQSSPSTTWVIPHNLNRYPSAVSVIDSAGTVCVGQVTHDTVNQLTVHFGAAFSGRAEVR